MSNTDTLSHEANEMHAGAADYDERRAVLAEMNAETVRIPKGFQFNGNFDFSEIHDS